MVSRIYEAIAILLAKCKLKSRALNRASRSVFFYPIYLSFFWFFEVDIEASSGSANYFTISRRMRFLTLLWFENYSKSAKIIPLEIILRTLIRLSTSSSTTSYSAKAAICLSASTFLRLNISSLFIRHVSKFLSSFSKLEKFIVSTTPSQANTHKATQNSRILSSKAFNTMPS